LCLPLNNLEHWFPSSFALENNFGYDFERDLDFETTAFLGLDLDLDFDFDFDLDFYFIFGFLLEDLELKMSVNPFVDLYMSFFMLFSFLIDLYLLLLLFLFELLTDFDDFLDTLPIETFLNFFLLA